MGSAMMEKQNGAEAKVHTRIPKTSWDGLSVCICAAALEGNVIGTTDILLYYLLIILFGVCWSLFVRFFFVQQGKD